MLRAKDEKDLRIHVREKRRLLLNTRSFSNQIKLQSFDDREKQKDPKMTCVQVRDRSPKYSVQGFPTGNRRIKFLLEVLGSYNMSPERVTILPLNPNFIHEFPNRGAIHIVHRCLR